jgi:hypothetical protein
MGQRRGSRASKRISACSASRCELTDTSFPAAIDRAPATRQALAAVTIAAPDAATPNTRRAVYRMPSLAPSTAVRSQLDRWLRWTSRREIDARTHTAAGREVRTDGEGGGHCSAGSLLDDALLRRATSRPACQPGARPCSGGRRSSVDKPAVAISQAATEFEFHISPVSSSSRPHTGVGTVATASRSRRATRGSLVSRWGPPTAAPRSAMDHRASGEPRSETGAASRCGGSRRRPWQPRPGAPRQRPARARPRSCSDRLRAR